MCFYDVYVGTLSKSTYFCYYTDKYESLVYNYMQDLRMNTIWYTALKEVIAWVLEINGSINFFHFCIFCSWKWV
jgi:hypothetical protein